MTAAELLVEAYMKGEAAGGSVDWSDVDLAYQIACEELGDAAVAEIKEAMCDQ
jgi:hypothetical protein